MVLVRATTTTDWQALREIRLQALLDAPDAFASTHAREASGRLRTKAPVAGQRSRLAGIFAAT
jgi:hypothetical protein